MRVNLYSSLMYGLVGSHDDGFVDVGVGASAREVAHRSCKALQQWADSLYTGKTLHQFVGDVANFERREYQHIGLASDRRLRSLELGDNRHNGGISLKFSVKVKFGCHFVGYTCGFDDFVDTLMLGTPFSRE